MSAAADLHATVLAALAEKEAVEAAGTPGPWLVDKDDAPDVIMKPDVPGSTWDGFIIARLQPDDFGLIDHATGDLIVAARNAYPAALRWARRIVTEHGPEVAEHDVSDCLMDDEGRLYPWPCATYVDAAAVVGVHIPPHDEEQAGE